MGNTIQTTSDLIVKPIEHMGSDRRIIEAMLVSTMSEEDIQAVLTESKSTKGRINFLMRERHGSPFEHNAMTFYVAAPIMVFREFHRHRIGFSYNERSGRYSKLEDLFYIPPEERPLIQVGKPGEYRMLPEPEHIKYLATIDDMLAAYQFSYERYERILERGHAKEIARSVLGVGIYSAMYVTCNARSLMSFLSLRVNEPKATFPSKPQWEIWQVANQMEAQFSSWFPHTHAAFIEHGRVAP